MSDARDSAAPEGFGTVTSHLIMRDAAAAMEWYADVFGATEELRLSAPDDVVAHGELRIGDSLVMVAEENEEWGNIGPATLGGSGVRLSLYVPDVDEVFQRAVAAGAEVEVPVTDLFYGDRTGRIRDPFGHTWVISSRVEEVSPEEMQKRFDSWFE